MARSDDQERAWRPIWTGAEAENARDAIEAIAVALDPEVLSLSGGSLGAGSAGIALFFAYKYLVDRSDRSRRQGVVLLDAALDWISGTPLSPALFGGFTGAAWAAAHLARILGMSIGDDAFGTVNDALVAWLDRECTYIDYDLINGLAGIAVYALEQPDRAAAAKIIASIIDLLLRHSEKTGAGTTWRTAPETLPEFTRAQFPTGYYNLGMAHGVPGIVVLLSNALRCGLDASRARPLLAGAVRWLLAQDSGAPRPSRFGWYASDDGESGHARLAWCYGDPSIAVALRSAGVAMQCSAWLKHADSIAESGMSDAAIHGEGTSSGVTDATICHGAAGLAHIYNRLYQATGRRRYRRAAAGWGARTLAYRSGGAGIAGFAPTHPPPASDGTRLYVPDARGVLEGAAGIGLVLLGMIAGQRTDWDSMLLLSPPQMARG